MHRGIYDHRTRYSIDVAIAKLAASLLNVYEIVVPRSRRTRSSIGSIRLMLSARVTQ